MTLISRWGRRRARGVVRCEGGARASRAGGARVDLFQTVRFAVCARTRDGVDEEARVMMGKTKVGD